MCGVLGIGIPLQSAFKSCNSAEESNFEGKVLIIGAGAGGMSAGYLLQQMGVDFEIIEASDKYGGRMETDKAFADFPIPLGAEWLHAGTDEFDKMVNDTSVQVNIEMKAYESNAIHSVWENGELATYNDTDDDQKFVDATWFTFYEDYILPSIADKIVYNSPVQSINYAGDKTLLTISDGSVLEADRVIVAVPVKILQLGAIDFIPALSTDKREAIDGIKVWEGFKAFFEFSENFYHATTAFPISPNTDGQKLFYDAAYGQDSSRNILGVFSVGTPAATYDSMSDSELKESVLAELDAIFEGKATPSYIKHMTKNWMNEPFIQGGYITDHSDWNSVRKLSESVADKIYFAGGAYTDGNDWVAVHAAAASAKEAVKELVG